MAQRALSSIVFYGNDGENLQVFNHRKSLGHKSKSQRSFQHSYTPQPLFRSVETAETHAGLRYEPVELVNAVPPRLALKLPLLRVRYPG